MDKRDSITEEGASWLQDGHQASGSELSFSHGTRQVMELEAKNAQLSEELAAAPSARRAAGVQDWTPRAPARHTLQSHRSPITRVAFHPVFSQMVSASEDSTIKVWDWETGEFERTLKGHTKAVQDVEFDSKGMFLGEMGSRWGARRRLLTPLSSIVRV